MRPYTRFAVPLVILIVSFLFASCAHVSKRMPHELRGMRDFLSRENPNLCGIFHYNFERQVPRLYDENQRDSIFEVIDYIKTECGPSSNLEITRMLLLADEGRLGDSLIGPSTIPQMLRYRAEQEDRLYWEDWDYIYGRSAPIDNTHDRFTSFSERLARHVSENVNNSPEERAIGRFFGGEFDTAFGLIQSDEFRGTAMRGSYDEFIDHVKRKFPTRGNVALLAGSWQPRGNKKILGNHPDIGFQLGMESKKWRFDGIISYRFSEAENPYFIDSFGVLTATDKFNCWLFGVECGFKILDNQAFSTDIFAGLGYGVIYSLSKGGDPEETFTLGSIAPSIGLRHRFIIDKESGFYIGGILRYGWTDYNNPRGTDLSGNTLTLYFVTGWSFHETLHQFLKKLNYKGDWR
jgi:hypothetical protein